MLTEKCKNQEADIAEFEMREQEFQEIEAEAELLRRQVEASRYGDNTSSLSFMLTKPFYGLCSIYTYNISTERKYNLLQRIQNS